LVTQLFITPNGAEVGCFSRKYCHRNTLSTRATSP